jgi:hypothetical protein
MIISSVNGKPMALPPLVDFWLRPCLPPSPLLLPTPPLAPSCLVLLESLLECCGCSYTSLQRQKINMSLKERGTRSG